MEKFGRGLIGKKQKHTSISTMERSTKTSWGLTCMTTAHEIMMQRWGDG
jgi:hypothetical protein